MPYNIVFSPAEDIVGVVDAVVYSGTPPYIDDGFCVVWAVVAVAVAVLTGLLVPATKSSTNR